MCCLLLGALWILPVVRDCSQWWSGYIDMCWPFFNLFGMDMWDTCRVGSEELLMMCIENASVLLVCTHINRFLPLALFLSIHHTDICQSRCALVRSD